MSKLTIELSKAQTELDIIYLLNICDKLHNGEKVKGYTKDDLPPDSIYEQYKNKLKDDNSNKIEKGTIMYMGSIPKEKEIKNIDKAIFMPKFDGCSVALRFQIDFINKTGTLIHSHTRGSDVGNDRICSDLTEKMQLLIPKIYFKESKIIEQLFKLVPTFINIRGEIVLKNKELDENGFNKIAPAADIAGKINGGIEVFKNYLPKIRICGFEISSVERLNAKNKIFTQETVSKILNNIYYIESNSNNKIYLKDYKAYIGNTQEINFEALYERYQDEDPRPLDGIVYCGVDWKYPNKLEDTTATKYGKFAWKPNNEIIINIKKIEYSIGRDGDYSPMIIYDKVKLDKNYERAKSAISKLNILIENGLGVNAKALLKINHGINPQVYEILTPAEIKFKLPETCLYCNSKLVKEYHPKTNELMHLRCTNGNCSEVILQKYSYLLEFMYKKCKLITLNQQGKIIKSKLSEKNLKKMTMGNLSIELIQKQIPNLKEEFNKLSLVDQLCALSFGAKLKVEKKIKEQNITKLEDIKNELWCDIL